MFDLENVDHLRGVGAAERVLIDLEAEFCGEEHEAAGHVVGEAKKE